MKDLGSDAPFFDLPAANSGADGQTGERRSLHDYEGARALVVVFTCNHCPYAQHVEDTLIDLAREYRSQDVRFVAISSNDPEQYPADSFEAMAERAADKDYPFAYLFDGTQEVAKAYGAVCTPDVFVFDGDQRLAYRGRIDETRPGAGESTGKDLRRALDAHLERGETLDEQRPSMGCNIKWKAGNQPQVMAGPVPEDG